MKGVFLTGSHPRHAFMARSMAQTGRLAGLVIEQREVFVPEPPVGLSAKTASLFERHFAGRDEAEDKFFGVAELPEVPRLDVEMTDLNTRGTVDFINNLRPHLVLSYGVHKLSAETLSAIGCSFRWNIHGGLSPWYRGVITHFWPSYLLEPQMTGMTIHELTENIDGGDLIHQTAADLVRGDGVHDIACRAVTSLGSELPQLFSVMESAKIKSVLRQGTTGRIWRSADWQPAHLHLVYDYYGNQIVDRYLNGEFTQNSPTLFRQF